MHRVVDGEAVLVDLAGGNFFGLDEVGTFIWEGMDGETAVAALVDRVVGAFEVTSDRAGSDLLVLLNEMADRGLVRAAGAASTA